jgi:hypothetical protein
MEEKVITLEQFVDSGFTQADIDEMNRAVAVSIKYYGVDDARRPLSRDERLAMIEEIESNVARDYCEGVAGDALSEPSRRLIAQRGFTA